MHATKLLIFLIIIHIIIPVIKVFHIKKSGKFRSKDNSFFPPRYNISHWIDKFHLQHCVFVEIGEGFCALFVEMENLSRTPGNSKIDELFLGICDCGTLRSWKLCSSELLRIRQKDCVFSEATPTSNTSARVHRRLCDINLLKYLPICKCFLSLAGRKLHQTEGFPTCFLEHLPKSICFPRGVCGVAKCTVKTIMGIHSPRCDPDCRQKQPFCEEFGLWSSVKPKVMSSWSEWSEPECNVSCGKGSLVSRAFCGKNGIDCIGPGPFCCANTRESCECKVFIENGIMEVKRFTMPCTRSISCPIVSRRRGFLPENQIMESESYDIDEYEEFNREKINGNSYDDADYEILKKNNNEEFEKRKRTVDDDDKDYDSVDTENTSDNIEDNEEEENEENNNDMTMPAVTTDDYETVYEDRSNAASSPKSRILFPIFTNFVILWINLGRREMR